MRLVLWLCLLGAVGAICVWPAMQSYGAAGGCACVPGYISVTKEVLANGTSCKFPCPPSATCVAPPKPILGITQNNWSCEICGNGVRYGGAMDSGGNAPSNWPTQQCPLWSQSNEVPMPVPESTMCCQQCGVLDDVCTNCYADLWCKENYYRNDVGLCVLCPQTQPKCAEGFYLPRCSSVCEPCAYPALGPNQQYGIANPLLQKPSCPVTWPYTDSQDLSECAFYGTPLYKLGGCSVLCKAGSFWNGTQCSVRVEACAPGMGPDPRYDLATSLDVPGSGACVPCTNHPPPNASYTTNCEWSCAKGLWWNASACVACVAKQCAPGYWFMGCSGSSSGGCVQCTLTCQSGVNWLYTGMDAARCECRTCTPPSSTVVKVSDCNATSDARYRTCTQCVSGVSWMSSGCTVQRDTECTPCSVVPRWMRLQSICDVTHDTVYVACPDGYACDGTASLLNCTWPSVLSSAQCVCAPGYVDLAGACVVKTCPSGQYPTVNDTCEACNLDADSIEAVVVPGVLGIEACTCPSNAFRVGQHCWPCGTLDCANKVQGACVPPEGPQCVCAPPWGAHVTDNDTCAFECLAPAVQAVQAVQAYARPRLFCNSTTVLSMSFTGSALAALAEPQAVLLSDNRLLLPNIYQELPTDFFEDFWHKRISEITAIARFDPLHLWLSFTYSGNCLDRSGLDIDETGDLLCTAVYLIVVPQEGDASLDVSWTQGVMQSGYSQYGGIYAMATSEACTDQLFLAQHDAVSGKLFILAYSQSSGSLDLLWQQASSLRITSLVVQPSSVRGKSYAWGATSERLYQWAWRSCSLWTLLRTWDLRVGPLFAVDAERLGFGLDGWLDTRNELQQRSSTDAVVAVHQDTRLIAGPQVVQVQRICAPCAPDHLCYNDDVACKPMPCVKGDPYGPEALRTGACKAGYVRSAEGLCMACPIAYYCPDGNTAVECPSNSVTSAEGATGLRDCMCSPGFYSYGVACLPCDTSSWCPGGKSAPQLPCVGHGTTTHSATSPLQCDCPTRTYGLACQPCPRNALCKKPRVRPEATLLALELSGAVPSVPPGGELVLYAPRYAVLYVPGSSSIDTWVGNHTLLASIRCGSGLGCASLQQRQDCEHHWEWNGNANLQVCVCAGGYAFQTSTQTCTPCAPGTARPSLSQSTQCWPCNASLMLHAPYAGMTACVCKEATHPLTGECLPHRLGSPADALLWISLTASASVGVLLCTAFAVQWKRSSSI